jgi:hypothetical protein
METGQSSPTTAGQARTAFSKIFGITYEEFKAALEKTGTLFQTNGERNNPPRDDLRPEECTNYCRNILTHVLEYL